MTRALLDLNISFDDFTSGGHTPKQPMGEDWDQLMGSYIVARTVRARTFGDTIESWHDRCGRHVRCHVLRGVGAETSGPPCSASMPLPTTRNGGSWGEEPPFHGPVYVLTHTAPRPRLEMQGSTTFHFRNSPVEHVLAEAKQAADALDVRVGGMSTGLAFLRAGLVDDLHVAIVPIVFGRGTPLWDDLRSLELTHEVHSEVTESGTSHVTFRRRGRTDCAVGRMIAGRFSVVGAQQSGQPGPQ